MSSHSALRSRWPRLSTNRRERSSNRSATNGENSARLLRNLPLLRLLKLPLHPQLKSLFLIKLLLKYRRQMQHRMPRPSVRISDVSGVIRCCTGGRFAQWEPFAAPPAMPAVKPEAQPPQAQPQAPASDLPMFHFRPLSLSLPLSLPLPALPPLLPRADKKSKRKSVASARSSRSKRPSGGRGRGHGSRHRLAPEALSMPEQEHEHPLTPLSQIDSQPGAAGASSSSSSAAASSSSSAASSAQHDQPVAAATSSSAAMPSPASASSVSASPSASGAGSSDGAAGAAGDDSATCAICSDRPRHEAVCLPCGHAQWCNVCPRTCTKCPICFKNVDDVAVLSLPQVCF